MYVSAHYATPDTSLPAPPPGQLPVVATDDQGVEWHLTEDSQVGDWLRFIEAGGVIAPAPPPPPPPVEDDLPMLDIQPVLGQGFTLPPGGRWYWWALTFNANGRFTDDVERGTSDGGTVILPGVPNRRWVGFARRTR